MFNVITGAVDDAVDAIGGVVRHAVASLPGGSASFRVQPEQVYRLANHFDVVADDIQDAIGSEVGLFLLRGPGADLPSEQAAARLRDSGFGEQGLVTRLAAYARELRKAAASLRETGRQYGLTDHTESARLGAGLH